MRQEDGEQSPERDRSAAASTVVSDLRTRVSSEELAIVTAFAKLFLPNARLIESALTTSNIAGLTLGACRFLCDRHTLPVAFRAYVPTSSEHGWSSPNLVLEIATDDQSGLVNSICGVVEQQGAQIEALVSAVARVERNPTGLAQSIAPAAGQGDECIIHLQLSGVDNPAGLENGIRQHLEAVGRTNRESGPLLTEMQTLSARLSTGTPGDLETAQLLAWLADGRFNLAGIQEIGPDGSTARALGIYLDPPEGLEADWDGAGIDRNLYLLKTRAHDPVHMGEFLEEIRLRPSHPTGSEARAYRIAGTLGSRALRERASGAPLARTVCAAALEALRASDPAIDTDTAATVFDGLPIDFVLALPAKEVAQVAKVILTSHTQPGFRVCVSSGPAASRGISFLTIVVPRQHLARNDADKVGQIVRERIAPILTRRFVSDDLTVARLHYAVDIAPETVRPELLEDLSAQIRKALSSWRDAPVVDSSSAPVAERPTDLKPPPQPRAAEGEREPSRIEIQPDQTSTRRFSLRVETGREPGTFNQLVSAIDDLGLRILRHQAETGSESTEVHELSVEVAGDGSVDPAILVGLLQSIRDHVVESDQLSALCWRAEMSASSIDILRAFSALAELHGAATRRAVQETIVRNVEAAQALMRAFEKKFDPRLPLANDNQRNRDLGIARGTLDVALERAETGADRKTLRQLARLLDRVVRTSFYCGDRNQPGRAIALKLENREDGAAPYQTFVYAPSFEGHLSRVGLAARVRLDVVDDLASLRSHDSRDLVDQMLRASHLSTDPGLAKVAVKSTARSTDQSDRAFRTFIEALLDVTDNVVNGELVRSPEVIAYDQADSYFCLLVAERPTGLADLARGVIEERAFWMGDAAVARFDPRVAAEGAWAGLQVLFARTRSSGEPITVVAIGSPHELRLPPGARLVAAFDHHELFLDPTSDPKKCSEALSKLNRQDTSSWSDFPVDLRERGSTVVSRDTPKVELSEEARDLLGWSGDAAGAKEIIEAVLAMQSDLLWVCGASTRALTTAEIESGPSDRLEVEVSRIGARAVVEVGQEFFSPRARIAFALAGGIVHSPPCDGIAADLLADRVSNIDLALGMAGSLREGVEAYSAEVAAEIRREALEVPPRQVLAIELDLQRSEQDRKAVAVCLRRLREQGRTEILDHYSISETEIARRCSTTTGLSRPEIAAMRAAVGLRLQLEIRGSSLGEDPYIRPWLDDYFPAPIAQQSPHLVEHHPLRYEIAALAVSERILEVMGFTFIANAAETHGRPELDIVKAWCAALIFGGAQEVWAEIESSGIVAGSPDHQNHRLSIARALRDATRRIIEIRSVELSLEKIMDRLAAGVGEILRAWPDNLPDSMLADHEDAIDRGARTGLGRVAADHLARIAHLAEIVDICDLAIHINAPRSTVAGIFLGLDPLFRFTDIDQMIQTLRHQDPQWGERASAHLHARLSAARRSLTTEVVANAAGRRQPIERYVDANETQVRAVQRMIGEVRSGGQASIAAVEVLLGGLENLTRGQRRSW